MKILRKMKNIFLALMIGREPLIAVLKTIIKVRILEKKLIPLFRQGKVKRMIYSDYGQEGGVAAVTHFLEKKDVLMPHYRGFTAAIGKGMNTKGMVGEMVAKKTGTVAGYGGAGNFFSTEDNIYSAPAILGQGFSVVIGMGLATRFRNDGSIVVMFFGDGTTTRGNFYSALNLAVLWSLPILFVCINNQYSVTTRFTDTSMTPLIEKVRSFGMPSVSLDGNDVVALFSPTKKIISSVREKRSPAFIELQTYRVVGHNIDDAALYVPQEEKMRWSRRDPYSMLMKTMSESGLVRIGEVGEFWKRYMAEVDSALASAEEEPSRSLEELEKEVYA